MIVACREHGPQSGLMISADLANGNSGPVEIIDLLFEYEGVIAWEFHVSREFADSYGLVSGTEPLPDQPGEWATELQCWCVKCFEEMHNGSFDENHRWVHA